MSGRGSDRVSISFMSKRQEFFKKAIGVLRSTKADRILAPLTQGFGAVFMMHHVRAAPDRPFQPNKHLEITPEFLKLSVNRIRSNGYDIISMDEAVDRIKTGYGRKRYAVLTFDDGYHDNLDVVYPILKQMDVPFTVFIATGFVDRTSLLWWLILEEIIAHNDEIRFTGHMDGQGIASRSLEEKYRAFEKISQFLTTEVEETEQRLIVDALADRYKLSPREVADRRIMTWDEVRQLNTDPLVTIGAHTEQHFSLARLDRETARRDIQAGVERLEQELGQRPKHFAFPYGKAESVCSRDADQLREMGFASSVTTMPGVLQSAKRIDTMMLPRVSLNGQIQDPAVIDHYLTGAPFALYNAARWVSSGFGVKAGVSRLFPSTR